MTSIAGVAYSINDRLAVAASNGTNRAANGVRDSDALLCLVRPETVQTLESRAVETACPGGYSSLDRYRRGCLSSFPIVSGSRHSA